MNKKEFIETLIDMGGCGAKPKSWARGWDDAIGEVIGIAEELDEPEKPQSLGKLIHKWECARDSAVYYGKERTIELAKYFNDFVGDLESLAIVEPSKPVIPQFVADWIEEIKKQSKSLVFAITHIYDNNEIGKSPNKEEKRIFQWMELADNEEVFARSWLDGYEVEEEQKYQVIIKDGEYIRLYLCKHGDNVIIGTNDNYIEKCPEVTYLTEQEIKDYDERYWAFAQEVCHV